MTDGPWADAKRSGGFLRRPAAWRRRRRAGVSTFDQRGRGGSRPAKATARPGPGGRAHVEDHSGELAASRAGAVHSAPPCKTARPGPLRDASKCSGGGPQGRSGGRVAHFVVDGRLEADDGVEGCLRHFVLAELHVQCGAADVEKHQALAGQPQRHVHPHGVLRPRRERVGRRPGCRRGNSTRAAEVTSGGRLEAWLEGQRSRRLRAPAR